MEHDIVRKLRTHLQNPVDTEPMVVYLLCQLRKLGAGKKIPFSLQMCFNWAMHVELDRNSGADDFLKKLDGAVEDFLKINSVDVFLEPLHLHEELLFLGSFRKELKDYLGQQKLPTDLCDDPEQWRSFIREYSGVIEDGCIKPTSNKKKPSTLKYIEKVEFSRHPAAHQFILPFEMRWTIHCKPNVGKIQLLVSEWQEGVLGMRVVS